MRLHNLCLELFIPLIEVEVLDMMDPAVTNNALVKRAAVNKRQQRIENVVN
ncbi:hypothetical protein DPMN_159136 [Dreissena polymorpha]|uniref:Uncharacterized protein n=1 Tax=Dreissena polymorpha TaxID=45954 RepID=A0A9D4IQF7_DREPO|nr:hypothetical protein DPMN_159136 [Dreissena polymorpha]